MSIRSGFKSRQNILRLPQKYWKAFFHFQYSCLCEAGFSEMCCVCAQPCPILCDPTNCSPPGSLWPWDSPGKNTGVGCHGLLQGIFLTLGSNLCVSCIGRQILYYWVTNSNQSKIMEWVSESCSVMSDSFQPHGVLQDRILEWVAFPFSRASFQPRNQTRISCNAGRFFTSWTPREAQLWSRLDISNTRQVFISPVPPPDWMI